MKTVAMLTTAFLATTSGLSMAQPTQMAAPASSSTAVAAALVNGEVRQLDPATGLILLKHSDIPNLAMPAMTMGSELDGFKVGDKVRFQAEMVKGKPW